MLSWHAGISEPIVAAATAAALHVAVVKQPVPAGSTTGGSGQAGDGKSASAAPWSARRASAIPLGLTTLRIDISIPSGPQLGLSTSEPASEAIVGRLPSVCVILAPMTLMARLACFSTLGDAFSVLSLKPLGLYDELGHSACTLPTREAQLVARAQLLGFHRPSGLNLDINLQQLNLVLEGRGPSGAPQQVGQNLGARTLPGERVEVVVRGIRLASSFPGVTESIRSTDGRSTAAAPQRLPPLPELLRGLARLHGAGGAEGANAPLWSVAIPIALAQPPGATRDEEALTSSSPSPLSSLLFTSHAVEEAEEALLFSHINVSVDFLQALHFLPYVVKPQAGDNLGMGRQGQTPAGASGPHHIHRPQASRYNPSTPPRAVSPPTSATGADNGPLVESLPLPGLSLTLSLSSNCMAIFDRMLPHARFHAGIAVQGTERPLRTSEVQALASTITAALSGTEPPVADRPLSSTHPVGSAASLSHAPPQPPLNAEGPLGRPGGAAFASRGGLPTGHPLAAEASSKSPGEVTLLPKV